MPALQTRRPITLPRARVFPLSKGRSVPIVEDHALPVVSARIVWSSGASDETLANAGIGALAIEELVSSHSGEAARARAALDDLGA